MGYDIQAALALRGVRAIHKPRDCAFVFVVVETDPPYACSFVGLTPEYEAFADRKVTLALERWRHCLESGQWPGYPNRIAWAVPPAWAETQFGERAHDL